MRRGRECECVCRKPGTSRDARAHAVVEKCVNAMVRKRTRYDSMAPTAEASWLLVENQLHGSRLREGISAAREPHQHHDRGALLEPCQRLECRRVARRISSLLLPQRAEPTLCIHWSATRR